VVEERMTKLFPGCNGLEKLTQTVIQEITIKNTIKSNFTLKFRQEIIIKRITLTGHIAFTI
jgi:hypothetical protein